MRGAIVAAAGAAALISACAAPQISDSNVTATVEFFAPRERRFVLNPEAGIIQREPASTTANP
jgi:hypothetical protein